MERGTVAGRRAATHVAARLEPVAFPATNLTPHQQPGDDEALLAPGPPAREGRRADSRERGGAGPSGPALLV
jgi:hypothetical protein